MPDCPPESAQDSEAISRAKTVMLRLLARRDYSVHELREKLLQRIEVSEPALNEILAQLQQQGLQSDARCAQLWLSRAQQQGWGPIRLQSELQRRGISESLLEPLQHPDWVQLATAAARKRFGPPPTTAREWQRQARFLQQRGFNGEQVHAALGAD